MGMNSDKLVEKLLKWAQKREAKKLDAGLLREAAEQIQELKRLNKFLRETP